MKKLLLTSDGLENKKLEKALLKLLNKKPSDTKLIMISISKRTKVGKYYVNLEIELLFSIGFKRDNITVLGLSDNKGKNLSDFDVIFVCGGNTYHYLSKIRKLGLDKEITKHVKAGKVYFGISAGSILAGPSIKISGWGKEGDPNDIGLKNLTGLKFTNTTIFPHYEPRFKKDVESFQKKFGVQVVTLTDGQALLVLGDKQEVI